MCRISLEYGLSILVLSGKCFALVKKTFHSKRIRWNPRLVMLPFCYHWWLLATPKIGIMTTLSGSPQAPAFDYTAKSNVNKRTQVMIKALGWNLLYRVGKPVSKFVNIAWTCRRSFQISPSFLIGSYLLIDVAIANTHQPKDRCYRMSISTNTYDCIYGPQHNRLLRDEKPC